MGVADNKTYKDQYHFNDKWFKVKGEDYPSINDEDKINSTIKENPYRSNVEIEGREVVLQPDLSALFKAVGKRHSNGGMDVMLKPESFIFSDDKTLNITEDEHELFEFKKGGNFKPTNTTPAAVLKRNIDVKHYNTLVNNLDDIKKDDLTKKSSAMMLEKYIQLLGNIAYVQEEKKGFPQGVPSFSMGTAPVYDSEIKQEVMESKQYKKFGGAVEYAPGGFVDPCPCGKDSKGNCLPCTDDVYQNLLKLPTTRKVKEAPVDYTKLYSDPTATLYGKFGTDPKTGNVNVPMGIPGGKMNDQWKKAIQSMIDKGATLDQLVKQKHGTKAGLEGMFKFPVGNQGTPDDYVQVGGNQFDPSNLFKPFVRPELNQQPLDNPTPGQVTGGEDSWKNIDWQFTPWQKISQGYNFGQVANVKRYMPFRSRFNATYTDPVLLNEQQAVGSAKGLFGQQLSALKSLNPILAGAQGNSSYGQLLDQIPQIGLNVQNQNAGITNQFRAANTQTRNQETLQNMQNDQNYYKEAVIGRQNFDNMRTFTANNAMNNVLRDVETNQKLAYNELTMNNPAYSFDFKTGNFKRNMNKNILDAQGRTGEDTWQAMVNEAERLSKLGIDKTVISALVRGKFFQQAAPYFQQAAVPPPFPTGKRGGTVKRNPYK